nr:hypothetical protein [Streptomyces chrestomyceticus]
MHVHVPGVVRGVADGGQFGGGRLTLQPVDLHIGLVDDVLAVRHRFEEPHDREAGVGVRFDQGRDDEAAVVGDLGVAVAQGQAAPALQGLLVRVGEDAGGVAEERAAAFGRAGCRDAVEDLELGHEVDVHPVPVQRHEAGVEDVVLGVLVGAYVEDRAERPLHHLAPGARVGVEFRRVGRGGEPP